jgi:hypothetical protein
LPVIYTLPFHRPGGDLSISYPPDLLRSTILVVKFKTLVVTRHFLRIVVVSSIGGKSRKDFIQDIVESDIKHHDRNPL